jgi:hypothetical protein
MGTQTRQNVEETRTTITPVKTEILGIEIKALHCAGLILLILPMCASYGTPASYLAKTSSEILFWQDSVPQVGHRFPKECDGRMKAER